MRPYADVFLEHEVALIGPGDAGEWRAGRPDADFDGSFVRRFATEVRIGDVFLLRTASAQISAVGIVASEYLYLSQFDDVNGWDLQHGRRVRWFRLPVPYDFGSPVFGTNPSRFSTVSTESAVEYARKFINSPPTSWQTVPLPGLPPEQPPLEEVPEALRDIVGHGQDLLSLYGDERSFGEPPLEDELLTHLVVPFLRALGWPPELVAIKWRRIDVCLFKTLPRTSENCALVLEAKRLGMGVEGALGQARAYLDNLGIRRDIVVTDGIRYRLYAHDQAFMPVAYANMARLKKPAVDLFERITKT
jgi:hypothetical protein